MSDDKELELVEAKDTSLVSTDPKSDDDILKEIIACDNRVELQKQLEAFKLSMAKKSAIRSVKNQHYLELVEDQIGKRISTRPDEISHADLLRFEECLSNQIDKSAKYVEEVANNSSGAVTTNTDVTINLGTDLTKDNRENVVNAMKQVLALLGTSTDEPAEFNKTTVTSNPVVVEEEDNSQVVEEVKINPIPIINPISDSENES